MFRHEVLFVHGACSGPWFFRGWSASFASEGWAVRSVTLPGHGPGENPAGYGLEAYVEAVDRAILEPERTVLVAHSLGGWVVLKILESRQVAASVLLAPVPHAGPPAAHVRSLAARSPWRLLRTLASGWVDPAAHEALFRELAFGPEAEGDAADRFMELSNGGSVRALRQLAMLGLGFPLGCRIRPRRLSRSQAGRPHLVVASRADVLAPPEDLVGTARLLGAEMLELEGLPHAFPMLDGGAAVAGSVMGWLGERLDPNPPPARKR